MEKFLLFSAILQVNSLFFCHCSYSGGLLREYYVEPTTTLSPSTVCPSQHVSCHSLQYYAHRSNFTNNSVFYFLNGEHSLETVVDIVNIVNLSLVGVSPDVRITCSSLAPASAGFYIHNFIKLTIENLTLSQCGGTVDLYRAAMMLINGTALLLNHTLVFNSTGYGLLAYNVGSPSLTRSDGPGYKPTSLAHSVFSNNQASSTYRGGNAIFFYSDCNRAYQVLISDCQFLFGHEIHMEFMLPGTGGLTVIINCKNVDFSVRDSLFEGNQGYFGGALFFHFMKFTNNSIHVYNSTFRKNSGARGAGIFIVLDGSVRQNDPISCKESNIPLEANRLMELIGLTISESSGYGALCFEDRMDIGTDCAAQYVLIKDTVFSRNNASTHKIGTAVYMGARHGARSSFTLFKTIHAAFQNVSFINNIGVSNDVTYQSNVVTLQAVTNVTFIDCTFESNSEAAIYALTSNLRFEGRNIFRNHSAYYGAGIALFQASYLFLKLDSYILFEDNHAESVGGALFVDSDLPVPATTACFFQVDMEYHDVNSNNSVTIEFINNTAGYAGSALYGGKKNCLTIYNEISGADQFKEIFKIANTETDPSALASDPYKACMCVNESRQPNCSYKRHNISAFPGEQFTLRLAVVGSNYDGAVPGAIHTFFDQNSSRASFGSLQSSQTSDKACCTDFNYTVFSTNTSASFYVTAEHVTFVMRNYFMVTVHLKMCPLGFALSHDMGKCVCDPVIYKHNIKCDINYQSILRPPNTWIGFVNKSSSYSGVLFHTNCPSGYCLPHSVNITSSSGDSQCESHRTGLFCGMCEEGHSLTLGTQKCVSCSNVYLLLVLPFAAAGIFLVFLLFSLSLTVTEGTINGLIFYANIIGMNHSMLFPGTSSRLYFFVAWLNLDLGITTCFFDGMDAYTEIWLQFIFPFYLWMIVLTIIAFYNVFPKLADRTGGERAVKVLATLLLLSYTKLQRTVVTIMTFTRLTYPHGVVHYVWLYDANVRFFRGKHLYLGIAGVLVFVLLIVPYTLCLAFFQHLQACSRRSLFQWVNKLKPLFDSYAGPYKDRYRTWTGLLLLVRTLLVILFTINITESANLNLLIILLVSLLLLMAMASSHGIYKKWSCDLLECFFYLQLGVFAGCAFYFQANIHIIQIVTDASIALSFAVFLCILVYHVSCHIQFCKRKCYYLKVKYYHRETEEEPLLSHSREAVRPVVLLPNPLEQ